MKVEQIRTELANVGKKIGELLGVRKTIEQELEALHQKFLADKIDAETYYEQQRRLADTDALIEATNRREMVLKDKLAPLEAAQTRTGRLAECKGLANQVQVAHTALLSAYADADAALHRIAKDLFQKRRDLMDARNRFAMVAGDDIGQFKTDLRAAGVSDDAILTATASAVKLDPLTYGNTIGELESTYHARRERDARKEARGDRSINPLSVPAIR